MIELRTPRLSLEPLQPAHADDLFEGLRDPRIYEFMEEKPPESVAFLRSRYERLARRHSPDGSETWLNWVVRPLPERRPVGYVQATVRAGGAASIAYVLLPPFWGEGYAIEAVSCMVRHLVEAYGVTELQATVDERNRRSVTLLERLEFHRSGGTGADVRFTWRPH